MNSTIINLSGNSDKKPAEGQYATVKQSEAASRLEITKLETINEIQPTINEESNQLQSSASLQRTSHSDGCEIVEVKSVLDSVDGPRKHMREFTRPYRPNITVIENDEDEERVDQELKATISLSTDDDKGTCAIFAVRIVGKMNSLNFVHPTLDRMPHCTLVLSLERVSSCLQTCQNRIIYSHSKCAIRIVKQGQILGVIVQSAVLKL